MAVDKKISQLASGAPAQAGDEYVVARSGANYKLTLTNIAASMPATTITTGNLTFSSTAQRITGDFSNATLSNRLAFQTSTTNGATDISVIPNGTGANARHFYFSNSDAANASLLSVGVVGADATIRASAIGSGTSPAMTFYTGGSERVRIDTSGNVGIGTATPGAKLDIAASVPEMRLSASGGATGQLLADGSSFYVGPTGAHSLRLQTNGTTRALIDSSGNVGIGGTAGADTRVQVLGTAPSSGGQSRGYLTTQTIPSSTTTNFIGFGSIPATQAASFTCSQIYHYYAAQGSLGAGSAVTTQYGYFADSTLTGATNNYGFYSNIASGSNRWNFYAAGTANNYFAGRVGIGVTPTYALHVESTATEASRSFRLAYDSTYYLDIIQKGAGGAFFRSNNGEFVFNVTGTDYARLTTAGEFITGGTTDQGAYNLQCNGTGVWGAGAYVNGSDARLKDDITTLNDGLNVVSQLRPVTFKYKPDYSKDQNVQTGFIAQELQAVLAGKDYVDGIVQAGPNHLNVAYQSLIPILVKAIQELTARVAELEAK